jgi:invasion protein IalB
MTNLTQKLVIGGSTLVVGLILGWAGRGVTGYSTSTQFMTNFDSWRVACPAADQKGVSCEMIQDVVDNDSHQELVRIALLKMPDGKPIMDLTMPLGVSLDHDVGLVMGTEPVRTVKYRTCLAQGCVADFPLDDKLLASLNAGKDGNILITGLNSDKPIAIPLSLKGYGQAKHAYDNGEAKRGSWFWRMWS